MRARWIFDLLRSLNPKQREPNWKRWSIEVRIMVKAGHSHREIAELFRWANEQRTPRPGSDFCWAKVILSPAKLWRQWDQLVIQRDTAVTLPQSRRIDPNCESCHVQPWTQQRGKNGPRFCGQCADIAERKCA